VKLDPQMAMLAKICVAKIDAELAPLVACGLVSGDLANRLNRDLQREIAEELDYGTAQECRLQRTLKAVEIREKVHHAEQLSSAGTPCPICDARNGDDESHCWGCGAPLAKGDS
jgi:hypothetical protein